MSLSKIAKPLMNRLPSARTWVAGFAAAALLLWLNDRFLFESIQVISSSMRPTLLRNERAYLQRAGLGEYRRFDVVVINSEVLGHRIVKRIIGVPGDRVKLEDSWRVVINGQPLDYQPAPGATNRLIEAGTHEIQLQRNPKFSYETKFGLDELLLGPDEYYVLGDNRLASGDSRFYGVVKRNEIQGKLRLVWYSYDLIERRFRWERIGTKLH